MSQRNTIQNSLIYETVVNMKTHPTADDVYDIIHDSHPAISRATVYRNLNKLVELHKIRKVAVSGGPDRYDYLLKQHYHFKCEKCGRLFDVDMDVIPNLADEVNNKQGFIINDYDIIFTGICPDCKAKKM